MEEREPKLSWRKLSAQEGLKLLGYNLHNAARGSVLVAQGPIKSKHYAFRYRKGDGHILYRWGRLTGAEACYADGKLSTVRFYPDGFISGSQHEVDRAKDEAFHEGDMQALYRLNRQSI